MARAVTDLKPRLKALGITQRQFAERGGFAVSTVNRWALGELETPAYVVWILQLLEERAEIARRLR